MKTFQTPQIYVGTYKKYNEGSLFGEWLDLTDYDTYDEFYSQCQELHNDEDDIELMFQEWENIPDKFISECHLDKKVYDYIEAIYEMDNNIEAFNHYLNNWGTNIDKDFSEILEGFESAYQGYFEGDTEVKFTYFYVESNDILSGISEDLQFYFDYQKYARDLFITDYVEYEGHVFIRD